MVYLYTAAAAAAAAAAADDDDDVAAAGQARATVRAAGWVQQNRFATDA